MFAGVSQCCKRPLKRPSVRSSVPGSRKPECRMTKSERKVEVVEQGDGVGQFLFLGWGVNGRDTVPRPCLSRSWPCQARAGTVPSVCRHSNIEHRRSNIRKRTE